MRAERRQNGGMEEKEEKKKKSLQALRQPVCACVFGYFTNIIIVFIFL